MTQEINTLWEVAYRDGPGGSISINYVSAESEEAAVEITRSQLPDADVLGAIDRSDETIVRDGDLDAPDYKLQGDSAWIKVDNISIKITKSSEGVAVDTYPLGDEMATALTSQTTFFDTAALATLDVQDEEELQDRIYAVGEVAAREHASKLDGELAQRVMSVLNRSEGVSA